jgi:membrane associated rhomboid family serine protease
MFIVSIKLNGWKFEPVSVNPMVGPSADVLIQLGALDSSLIVDKNEWHRVVSPMVLHAGIVHYLVNMVALYFVGVRFAFAASVETWTKECCPTIG